MPRPLPRFESKFKDRYGTRYKSRFEVVLSDYTSSVAEWRRAQTAPKEELPVLNEEQRGAARKFGLTEEAYARSILAGNLGAARMHKRAVELGKLVGGIAREVNRKCDVVAVVSEMFKGRWLVRIQTPGGDVVVAVPRDLVDDLLDSEVTSEVRKLRSIVREALADCGSRR
jgi:hypothetical protein